MGIELGRPSGKSINFGCLKSRVLRRSVYRRERKLQETGHNSITMSFII
jgi:hypothetical protein